LLSRGEKVVQETRGWDDAKQSTFAQRVKEGSADYRYFPDPDIPSLMLSEIAEFAKETLAESLGELPEARRARYLSFGLKRDDAELFVRDIRYGALFDSMAAHLSEDAKRLASNYIANDLVKIVRDTEVRDSGLLDTFTISAEKFGTLIDMIVAKEVSSKAAKEILGALWATDIDPRAYALEHALLQKTDGVALESTVSAVITAHKSVADDYRAGKAAALEFLLGQCMKALKGAADPAILRKLLAEKLQ
ncbi:MAG TPA: Asp-tRNA(Asn)/Glu-tRNA(Gln) amidotransferase GatCAB subunit B, partial [Candidatus Paceibacterota bacterium]